MKNIGKIILLVLGVALIALSVKAFAELPGQKAALEGAVYLGEAIILPENEGKMVIIHGKPEMTAPAYDEELGLTLNTIKAYRYDEEYKQISREKGVSSSAGHPRARRALPARLPLADLPWMKRRSSASLPTTTTKTLT